MLGGPPTGVYCGATGTSVYWSSAPILSTCVWDFTVQTGTANHQFVYLQFVWRTKTIQLLLRVICSLPIRVFGSAQTPLPTWATQLQVHQGRLFQYFLTGIPNQNLSQIILLVLRCISFFRYKLSKMRFWSGLSFSTDVSDDVSLDLRFRIDC